MGALGFEPRSAGLFLEALASTDHRFSSSLQVSAAHRSMTGASYSSQVILRSRVKNEDTNFIYIGFVVWFPASTCEMERGGCEVIGRRVMHLIQWWMV